MSKGFAFKRGLYKENFFAKILVYPATWVVRVNQVKESLQRPKQKLFLSSSRACKACEVKLSEQPRLRGGKDIKYKSVYKDQSRKYSSVAQWRSNRLLTGRLLVRVQPGEFFIYNFLLTLINIYSYK